MNNTNGEGNRLANGRSADKYRHRNGNPYTHRWSQPHANANAGTTYINQYAYGDSDCNRIADACASY